MNSKAKQSLPLIYESWQTEDRELEACVDDVRDWMQEVSQLGIPHFGETATRLRPLRDRLVTHFQREDEMVSQLADIYHEPSPEVDAVRRQSVRDHTEILSRLDKLMERLNETDPPFDSWQKAMEEVELFVDILEQHEDQESESIAMLMPGQGDSLS